MIVGTAGHIDHGKSALIRALTGVDTDRLKEEKARGISIELGYAYLPLPLPLPGAAGPEQVIGFVDVPGHERFIHHMLAGATGIDFLLLVVAADDGVMPQTREHVQILDLLGVTRGVVVVSKIDRVSPRRVGEVEGEVRALLAGTSLPDLPAFRVAALRGDGIATLREHLMSVAAALPPRAAHGHFRLAIDRCFTLAGAGTVVTGTVHSGGATAGEYMLLSPRGTMARIRSMHVQNRPTQSCREGQRCALNLVGTQFDKSAVRRGDWILAAPLHQPTRALDVQLRMLAGAPRALRHIASVHLHLAAEHVTARVALLDATSLEPGKSGLARLTLPRPIGAVAGDRLVLRDASASHTLGGGVVLDPQPPARGPRRPERLAWLRAWRDGGAAGALAVALAQGEGRVDLAAVAAHANLLPVELDELVARVATVQPCVRIARKGSDLLVAESAWQRDREAILGALRAHHAHEPNGPGLTREQLRRAVASASDDVVFAAIVERMHAEGELAATGLTLHMPQHRVRLDDNDAALWHRIAPLLQAKLLAPPRVDQLLRQLNIAALDESALQCLLDRVARTGAVYRISAERCYLPAAVARLAAVVREAARDEQGAARPVTAAGIRDLTGIGRNIVIQILEFFDHAGFTRRVGNGHWLRGENRSMFTGEEV